MILMHIYIVCISMHDTYAYLCIFAWLQTNILSFFSNFVVRQYIVVNNCKFLRYYITTLEGKPGERHVYGITDTTHENPKNSTCLTCDIGPDCLFNDATFSPEFTYYILECLGPGIPRIELRYTNSNKIGLLIVFCLIYEIIILLKSHAGLQDWAMFKWKKKRFYFNYVTVK